MQEIESGTVTGTNAISASTDASLIEQHAIRETEDESLTITVLGPDGRPRERTITPDVCIYDGCRHSDGLERITADGRTRMLCATHRARFIAESEAESESGTDR